MRLELAEFPVKDVRFSQQTNYSDGVLEIDKETLLALVRQDNRIASADLDVAFPNEQTRVVNVRDTIEPRVKISGPGCVFPGILGPPETVGEGRTHRLSGITVMPSAEYPPTIPGGTAAQNTAILDMWGPAAEVTPFASTINLILILKLIDSVSELEAHTVIQSAEFKLANRLAETTRDKTPENVEVFEVSAVDPSLPRVVYILGCLTMLHEPHSLVAYYGLPIQESLPIFLHPNEFLDGALTTDARRGNGGFTSTWDWMNQPVVLELLRDHGKRLNFLGVILQRTRFLTEAGKLVSAGCASQMARLLGADGAIITRTVPSGNNFMDAMITLQACERKGIKTVLMTPERGGTNGTDLPLVFYVPEATAIVSAGSFEREIKLPTPTKVIGVEKGQLARLFLGDPLFDPWSELTRDGWRDIIGGIDWFGSLRLTCKEF
jgi:glycine reductase